MKKHTISQKDFVFLVGFHNDRAIVDKTLQNKYKRSSVDILLKKNLYVQALRLALYKDNEDDILLFLRFFNRESEGDMMSMRKQLCAEFGIQTTLLNMACEVRYV